MSQFVKHSRRLVNRISNTWVHGAAKQGTSTQERHWLGAYCTKWTRYGKANFMRNSKSCCSEQQQNQFSYMAVKPGHSHARKKSHSLALTQECSEWSKTFLGGTKLPTKSCMATSAVLPMLLGNVG